MARYIDADELIRLLEIDAMHRGDHFTKRDALRCVKAINTADVARKREVAIEIFAKLREAFYEEGSKLNNELSKAIRENNPIEENALLALASGFRAARRIIADCEAKFMAGANKSEILYGGPREGGRKHAEKEMEEWKKRGEQ